MSVFEVVNRWRQARVVSNGPPPAPESVERPEPPVDPPEPPKRKKMSSTTTRRRKPLSRTAVSVRTEAYEAIKRIAKIRGLSIQALCHEILSDYADEYFKEHNDTLQELQEVEEQMRKLHQKIGRDS